MLCVERHVSPVVVTDFANRLVREEVADKVSHKLERDISSDPENAIALEFAKHRQDGGGTLIVTKDHYYSIYRTQYFTEITVGIEVDDINQRPSDINTKLFFDAVDQFISVYRVVAGDGRVNRLVNIERNMPTVREAVSVYDDSSLQFSGYTRVAQHIPSKFGATLYSFKEFNKDLPDENKDIHDITTRLGHHLATSTEISEKLFALTECVSKWQDSGNHRFAVIESFSIAEVAMFDYLSELDEASKSAVTRVKQENKPKKLSTWLIINHVLPALWKEKNNRYKKIVEDLEKHRKIRNNAVHDRYDPTVIEAELAINTTHIFLVAVNETADFFQI